MGLGSKAAHFVSDLTTVILNPISDKPSHSRPHPHHEEQDVGNPEKGDLENDSGTEDGPDTSSFKAFLLSLLTPDSDSHSAEGSKEDHQETVDTASGSGTMENGGKKSFLSRSKQTLGRAVTKAARISGFRQSSESKSVHSTTNDSKPFEHELRPLTVSNGISSHLPDISEPSMLLSENLRTALYHSLPSLAQGRNWVLLYSTWRHGISLLTLYRRSFLCPGYSLLVVGDNKGATFGGLVEAPLQPTNMRKYQGTNNNFVFTDRSSHPVIFPSTGANRYFTLCSNDFLALGGGGHFALYLDGDLLSGSSSASETFGNSCLAHSEDFKIKEVELWGFVYASNYDEMITLCRTERPGICRW
ncbi:TLD domain-containing protein 2 isoform X2 [Iris pallida]|uniref:Oxidation resistance protein 1 n=1 Tax=Iris pallida TaxID=29817 RepID=A0AAX6HJE7_IRIPA|nr:TLD domain-containing protein 2 isoform X2 [Iris pallida]KAJ6841186.1 TLD domain-containing protein 2 isoform X2 [Iris pallida]